MANINTIEVIAVLTCLISCTVKVQPQELDGSLIFATIEDIRRMEFDSIGYHSELVPNQRKAVAIDVHINASHVYWSDVVTRNIQRAQVDSGSGVEVVVGGLGKPEGIAIDWVNKKLYWTDAGVDTIEASNLDGTNRIQLITTGLKEPRAIVLHPNIGYMFWSDWGRPAKIEKSGMDGNSRQVLIDSDITWPNALALDYTEQRIWWVDARRNKIESSDFNGRGRRMILRSWIINHAFGATIFRDYIYWTKRNSKKIFRANKFNGKEGRLLIRYIDSPRGIVAYHRQKQPNWENPCSAASENEKCSHMCLLAARSQSASGFSCHCPPGIELLEDKRTCNTSDVFACKQIVCVNGGSCIPGASGFANCSCNSNYTGERCEIPVTIPTTADRHISTTTHPLTTQPRADSNDTRCKSHEHQCNVTRKCIPKSLLCDGQEDCLDKSDETGCSAAECGGDEFQCASGNCINNTLQCNGAEDCPDRSDEIGCNCSHNEFRCGNGKCINETFRCDGADDCPDFSDEIGCNCSSIEFQCGTGYCINIAWRCDGEEDCSDNSDEIGCECKTNEFTCGTGKCIPEQWRCDGGDDCPDDSDEIGCVCGSNEFKCNSGQCIQQSWRCDGDYDCSDNSDETACPTEGPRCKHDEFQCVTSKTCLPQRLRCNGRPECLDRSDEVNCSKIACKNDEFHCTAYEKCIVQNWLCDGDRDCADGSDELNCTVPACSSTEFRCKADGKCITQKWVCDGDPDCSDQSDETNCSTAVPTCRTLEFQCATDGKCIHKSWRCDGEPDCLDQSDETNCSTAVPTCRTLEFQCATDGKCIHKSWRCDGEIDCLDRSDEIGCHPQQCNKTDEFSCFSGECVPSSGVCDGKVNCSDGSDEHQCEIRHCQFNGICSQICINSSDGFKCNCTSGYTLNSDNRTCKALGPDGFLLIVNYNDIRRMSLDLSNYTMVLQRSERLISVDYDFYTGFIYWSKAVRASIERAPIHNVSNVEELTKEDSFRSEGIAVDWINKKLYMASNEPNGKIRVSEVNGTNRIELITTDIDEPRAIAVHPLVGFMFWTDWGKTPKIEKCGMDGDPTSRQVLVSSRILWPNGVTIDYTVNRIWWVDAKLETIESIDLDGRDRRVVLRGQVIDHPFGITVFQDNIYWTDWRNENVYTANKYSGGGIAEVLKHLSSPMEITVYHQQRQPVGPNPCNRTGSPSEKKCSHICLLAPRMSSPEGFSCRCPPGYELLDDGRTCNKIGSDGFLLFVTHDGIRRVSYNAADHTTVIRRNKRLVAVDYDFNTGFIFWSNVAELTIERAPIDKASSFENIAGNDTFKSDGIAVDWINKKLYSTISKPRPKIEVSETDGTKRITLITRELHQPRAIAVHPSVGFMFWTDWGETPKIEKCGMDGNPTSRQVLVSNRIVWPNGVTIDYTVNRIWWVDAKLDTIESIDLDGRDRRVVLRGQVINHPYGITVFQDNIYWTDWQTKAVYRADKYTGTGMTTLVTYLEQPFDIKSYHRERQPAGPNPCERTDSSTEGTCSHICLLAPRMSSPDGFSCRCPPGYELLDDQRTCNKTEMMSCGAVSCLNNGTCVEQTHGPPTCSCYPNFTGMRCESKLSVTGNENLTTTVSPDTKTWNISTSNQDSTETTP